MLGAGHRQIAMNIARASAKSPASPYTRRGSACPPAALVGEYLKDHDANNRLLVFAIGPRLEATAERYHCTEQAVPASVCVCGRGYCVIHKVQVSNYCAVLFKLLTPCPS